MSNNFDGYIVPDKNLTKYDKKGAYQGYYMVSENGEISEYDKVGDYVGHYGDSDDAKIVKYDKLGRRELVFGNKTA